MDAAALQELLNDEQAMHKFIVKHLKNCSTAAALEEIRVQNRCAELCSPCSCTLSHLLCQHVLALCMLLLGECAASCLPKLCVPVDSDTMSPRCDPAPGLQRHSAGRHSAEPPQTAPALSPYPMCLLSSDKLAALHPSGH
jgi:hypothetical protein